MSLCENPLADSVEEAIAMTAAAKRALRFHDHREDAASAGFRRMLTSRPRTQRD